MIRPTRKIVTQVNCWRIVLILCALCVLCGKFPAQDFKTVAPGAEYAEVTRTIDNSPVRMNLLRLDLTKVRLDVVHAMDAAIGLEKTSSIATRHSAFAAINGGFFRNDDSIWAGDPAGVLQINGHLISESVKDRVALGIIKKPERTKVVFAIVTNRLMFVGFPVISKIDIDGINRESQEDETVIYQPVFKKTPTTNTECTEIILRDCKHVCWKIEFVDGKGGTPIPNDGYVITLRGLKRDLVRSSIRPGILATSQISIPILAVKSLGRKNRFNKVDDIVAGVPQLIKNGKIDITREQEKTTKSFVETRHPRTAVAKLKNGKFLMITVDGRSESSGGISLTDLAAYLLELGATDAMNLDGGGSSTMFLDGRVVNHPSDKEGERKVSDAILVTLRKPLKKR